MQTACRSFNRTNLESKLDIIIFVCIYQVAFNRTNLESKLDPFQDARDILGDF